MKEIFGGRIRTELHVQGSKSVSVTFEPFFILHLEITKCEDLENCLYQFFLEKKLNDYKVDGVLTYAYYKQHLDKLPKILIIHLKRFIYRERPIKMKEDIYFPNVLNIEDQFVSQGLKVGAFNKIEEVKGRQYRLFSVVNHKGV